MTIDYSETPPLVFVGYPAPFKELNLTNLREQRDVAAGGVPNVKAQAFNCPHCASPLTIHSPAIESIGCELRLDHRRRERSCACFRGPPRRCTKSRRSRSAARAG